MTTISHNTRLRSKMRSLWRKNGNNDTITIGSLLNIIQEIRNDNEKMKDEIKALEKRLATLESNR